MRKCSARCYFLRSSSVRERQRADAKERTSAVRGRARGFGGKATERPEATLRLARAAISFLADLQGRPAPDAAVVRRVHTALVATRTTKPRQATPVADVSMLVTYLKDLGSTEELPINELRQKAITLLSITAFCRPSDLACVARPSVLPDTARGTTNLSVCSRFRMDSIKWIDEGAELVFFGSKADKGMSGNTVLIERASDPDICPITTLKAYGTSERGWPASIHLIEKALQRPIIVSHCSNLVTGTQGLWPTARSYCPLYPSYRS